MSDNVIRTVVSKIEFHEDSKKRGLKQILRSMKSKKRRVPGVRIGTRVAIAAAVLATLGVTVYAMSGMFNFTFEKNDDTVIIGASLPDDVREQIKTEPVRAWNPGNGEISVKLGFAYMPEDMTERDNTPAKWYGTAGDNRNITFAGFDLRRGDFNEIIDGAGDAERFTAGDNDAYLIYTGNEISVYDKEMYVLFADGQFVVKAVVGRGITAEEIKNIAAGMTLSEETDDEEYALPVSNEFDGGTDVDIPEVIFGENKPVYEEDLHYLGDRATFDGSYFGINYSVKVEDIETFDGISGLDLDGFYDIDMVNQFTDTDGNFVSYKRTGIDYVAGKFTETVDMTKKMVVVTVKFDSDSVTDEHDIRAYLNTFNLAGLEMWGDGTIHPENGYESFVIDRYPGKNAVWHSSMYIKNLGDGVYEVGYLLDTEECDGTFYYYNNVNEIYYSLEK